jgi:rhodanese-related sulfurtransferase
MKMTSCNGTQVPAVHEKITAVKPQIAAIFHGKDGVVFVDPRPTSAIASTTGIIPGAINIALDDIRDGNLPSTLANRGIHVITSCKAGPMAALAAQELAKCGFTRVNYVEGGTQAWLDAGYATDR